MNQQPPAFGPQRTEAGWVVCCLPARRAFGAQQPQAVVALILWPIYYGCWNAEGGHQCREMRTRTSDRKHNVLNQALPAAPPPWHRDCMDRPMLIAMPWEIPANHPIVDHGSTASPSFGPGSFGK